MTTIGTANLTEIVGSGNITTDGYFSSTVEMKSSMNKTDGSSYYQPGTDGKKYPTAYIDFKNLGSGTFTLDSLNNSGFNSTCKTCSNHYSVIYTSVDDSDPDKKVTTEGYEYKLIKDGGHYTLEIDIDSLKNPTDASKKVTTGADLANAMVAITKEAFDFHYTQYAAEGSKLYIYDNREQDTGAPAATFDTFPFEPMDIGEYKFNLTSADGKNVGLTYSYNFKDIANNAEWSAVSNDVDGKYVKLTTGEYVEYNAVDHSGMARYDMVESYTFKDASGNDVSVTRDELIANYSKNAISKMLGATKVDWNATDYTRVSVSGDENPNVAIRSLFETDVDAPEYQKGINIQCSSNVGDSVKIPRFALHTVALRLYRMNVMSHESASEAISNVEDALSKLSSMRSTYGAYQNRLEHTYASRGNMEENIQAAESRIRDTDMADEMVELSKNNILSQVGEAMMAQANRSKEGILKLLQ